jgi:hypothetical protein
MKQNLDSGRKEAHMNRLHKGTVFLAAGVLSAVLGREAVAQTGPFQFYALTPCRVVDTRFGNGGIIASSIERRFLFRTVCGVPSAAAAVTVNATVVGPTAPGFLSLWPAGLSFPGVASLNFNAGEPALGNGAIVPLGSVAAGQPDMSTIYGVGGGPATLHLVIDVTGYFAP